MKEDLRRKSIQLDFFVFFNSVSNDRKSNYSCFNYLQKKLNINDGFITCLLVLFTKRFLLLKIYLLTHTQQHVPTHHIHTNMCVWFGTQAQKLV